MRFVLCTTHCGAKGEGLIPLCPGRYHVNHTHLFERQHHSMVIDTIAKHQHFICSTPITSTDSITLSCCRLLHPSGSQKQEDRFKMHLVIKNLRSLDWLLFPGSPSTTATLLNTPSFQTYCSVTIGTILSTVHGGGHLAHCPSAIPLTVVKFIPEPSTFFLNLNFLLVSSKFVCSLFQFKRALQFKDFLSPIHWLSWTTMFDYQTYHWVKIVLFYLISENQSFISCLFPPHNFACWYGPGDNTPNLLMAP